jgi:hypothetical protein
MQMPNAAGRSWPDYYRMLEVDPAASTETIRAAYAALAKRCHPDRNPGDAEAARRMREINEAYHVLGDPARRRQYDRRRAQLVVATAAKDGAAVPAHLASAPAKQGRAHGRLGSYALLALALAVLGGSIALAVGRAHSGRTAVAPPATNGVVRRVLATGPDQPPVTRAADVLAAAASYPGFGRLDDVRDAAHNVTAADHAWTFAVLACTAFLGDYASPTAQRAAVQYWRAQPGAAALDSGNIVVAVFDCASPTDQERVLSGLRALLGLVAPAGTPATP